MNLKQILLEIKNLDIYSPDEWEEYLSYFENMGKILPYCEENVSKDSPRTLFERIKNGQGANSENVNADISPKIISVAYLSEPKVRSPITLGVVSGSFDLLHIGHIRGFVFARQFLGQYSNPKLCALTLSDESISAKKGQSRPVLNLNERLAMLCGVRCIDYVIPLKEPNCLSVLEEIEPDYFFKASTDTIQDIVRMEISLVESGRGSVIFMPPSNSISTTKLINIVGGN
jgi:D-beta-D-heptose 7-phosphate kinase/D-beta-D-heptose 1-phosphate adenosyltransferase